MSRSAARPSCRRGVVSGGRRPGTRSRVPSVCVRQLREVLPARPDSVALLRRAAVGFAREHGATERQRDDIALAVSEALTSSVRQAYVGHAAPGVIELRASRARGALVIVVCDQGNAFQTRLDSRDVGLGLALIKRVTERLEVQDTTPPQLVRMKFAVASVTPTAVPCNTRG